MATIEAFFHSRIIEREPPESVIYDLRSPEKTTITLPPGSKWTSGPHWHLTHTEYLRVLKGRVLVRFVDSEIVVTSQGVGISNENETIPIGDDELRIEKGAVHEWLRVDGGLDPDAEEVTVEECTEPNDGEKQAFFWRVNGEVLHGISRMRKSGSSLERRKEEWRMYFKLLAVFRRFDNYPVLMQLPGSVRKRHKNAALCFERMLCYVVLALVHVLTVLTGWKISGSGKMPQKGD